MMMIIIIILNIKAFRVAADNMFSRKLTNSMAYGTGVFNAAFIRALQYSLS